MGVLSVKELEQAVDYRGLYNFNLPPAFPIKGFSLDSRIIKPGEAFIALKGKRFDGHDFIAAAFKKGASLVIAQALPPVNIKVPVVLVRSTLKALGDIAAFLRRRHNPLVVGITGSAGKTTIKEMTAFILKDKFNVCFSPKSFNNFVGLPQTLLSLRRQHKVCVLELGTNHKGEIQRLSSIAHPDVAVVANIGYAHAAFLGGKREILKEKLSVFSSNSAMVGVLNGDDIMLRKAALRNKHIFYGRDKTNHFYAEFVKRKNGYLHFLVNGRYKLRLNTYGLFNIYNALAAIAVGRLLGIKVKDAAARLEKFKFPSGRFQIREQGSFIVVNDAYNSNPFALQSALESLREFMPQRRRIAVISDMLELGKYARRLHLECGAFLEKAGFAHIIFLGKYTKLIAASLVKKGFDSRHLHFASNYRNACALLRRIAREGDVVFVKGSHAFQLEKIAFCLKDFQPA